MDRIFLDANVLFSAAYRPKAGLTKLWTLKDVELITSYYALEEARTNLQEQLQRARLNRLIGTLRVISEVIDQSLPQQVTLPKKDRPILLAAIHAQATHLLTGDITHFGKYYRKTIQGVLILPPAEYLHRFLVR